MPVKLEDNRIGVRTAMGAAAEAFLHEAAQLLREQAAQLSPVDTGQLKASWDYRVEDGEAQIGSPLENAIWNELGTGEYAAGGNGRKGGWAYRDEKENWHFTRGKRPNHTLQKAYDAKKNAVLERGGQIFGEMKK